MTTCPQLTSTGRSTQDAAATPATTERTQWVVRYRYPDGTDWFDTVDSPHETLAGARSYRAWYDREVGLPSRLVERYIRDTVLNHRPEQHGTGRYTSATGRRPSLLGSPTTPERRHSKSGHSAPSTTDGPIDRTGPARRETTTVYVVQYQPHENRDAGR